MVKSLHAYGFTADWINAWLAAIGTTVLCKEVRLGWEGDPVPHAVFEWDGETDLPDLITGRLPSVEKAAEFVIAELGQGIDEAAYRRAAETARRAADPTLAILTTDLGGGPAQNGYLPTGPFNVGVPRGETLFQRYARCLEGLGDGRTGAGRVAASLQGKAARIQANGLGFDYRRLAASVPGEAGKFVDPVVEVLAFYGLWLHPMGGDGRRPFQRGWVEAKAREDAFRWPVWQPRLDRWAIDALLDVVYRDAGNNGVEDHQRLHREWGLLGVTGLYAVMPFEPTGKSDPTRGYASRRLV